MNLFGFTMVILSLFILSRNYEWICKITIKELYVFSIWLFIVQLVVEFFFYFISLHGLGGDKLLFHIVI